MYMLESTLQRIKDIREVERPAAAAINDWKKLAELQVELTGLLNSLKPIFRGIAQHLRSQR